MSVLILEKVTWFAVFLILFHEKIAIGGECINGSLPKPNALVVKENLANPSEPLTATSSLAALPKCTSARDYLTTHPGSHIAGTMVCRLMPGHAMDNLKLEEQLTQLSYKMSSLFPFNSSYLLVKVKEQNFECGFYEQKYGFFRGRT